MCNVVRKDENLWVKRVNCVYNKSEKWPLVNSWYLERNYNIKENMLQDTMGIIGWNGMENEQYKMAIIRGKKL